MKRTHVAAIGLILTAAMAACDSQAKTTPGSSATGPAKQVSIPEPTSVPTACSGRNGKLKIGLVTINLQALFFNQINTAAKKVANKAGVDLQIVSGNDDSVTQANAVDTLVASGVDAVIVDAIDTQGIKPSLRKAAAAGVPVVAVDAVVTDPAVSAQVGTANADGGAKIGDLLVKESGGKGEVGIVGALNSTIQLERQKGFTDEVKSKGMTVGTVVDGRNVQESAQSAAENLLTGNPNLKYVYATGEPALVGLAAAVKSQAATKRPTVVGWDLSDPAVAGLKAGWIKGVVQQNTFEFGYQAMGAAIKLGCKQTVPKDIPVPTQIVTPANANDFLYYLEK
jgi:ribose transport system substrate-binding protein